MLTALNRRELRRAVDELKQQVEELMLDGELELEEIVDHVLAELDRLSLDIQTL